jgi:hypothetical protein
MYKASINKFFLLLAITGIVEGKKVDNSIGGKNQTKSGKVTNKTITNISFVFNNKKIDKTNLESMLKETYKNSQKNNAEEMIKKLVDHIVDEMYASIPKEQKATISDGDLSKQKQELKESLISQFKKNLNETIDVTMDSKISEIISKNLESEIYTNVVFLIKLLNDIKSDSENKEIENIFKKYKGLFLEKINLEAEIQAKEFISANTQTPMSDSEKETTRKNFTNILNEIKLMMPNDLLTLLELMKSVIKSEVRNTTSYYMMYNNKKITLNEMLVRLDTTILQLKELTKLLQSNSFTEIQKLEKNEKEFTEFFKIIEEIFFLFIPFYIK